MVVHCREDGPNRESGKEEASLFSFCSQPATNIGKWRWWWMWREGLAGYVANEGKREGRHHIATKAHTNILWWWWLAFSIFSDQTESQPSHTKRNKKYVAGSTNATSTSSCDILVGLVTYNTYEGKIQCVLHTYFRRPNMSI